MIDGATIGAVAFILLIAAFLMYPLIRLYKYIRYSNLEHFDFGKSGGIGWHGFWGIMWSLILIAAVGNFGGVSDSFRETDYERGTAGFTMGYCDWKLHFRDAAYKSELQFWRGGDEERGELSVYFQQECADDPTGLATMRTARENHKYIEPYRTMGSGGWDGTYPEWKAW